VSLIVAKMIILASFRFPWVVF